MEPWFGLPVRAGADVAWGARAIFRAGEFELLWDRQQWRGDGPARKPLETWVMSKIGGLALLRVAIVREGLSPDERRQIRVCRVGFELVANPNGSHGYLYMAAWHAPDGAVPTPGLRKADAPPLEQIDSSEYSGLGVATGYVVRRTDRRLVGFETRATWLAYQQGVPRRPESALAGGMSVREAGTNLATYLRDAAEGCIVEPRHYGTLRTYPGDRAVR